ncbi:MAG: Clp protease ClpP, partial [Deltaproteobacteria bacterium]|nr:Clp protease ClpP [Deltaproteobacteria bacterium]
MEIRTQHIVSRDKKEITLMLYGEIGKKIDGDYFASELEYLDHNYDTVIIRINSDGGLVTQGLSIVSQLLRMQAFTIAQIDGVAASMAAVIPVACDQVRMNDYARMMIHSPFMVDDAGKKIAMSAKDKKAAESVKGILVDLLSKRGKSKEEISKLLSEETWYTADEALSAGLVHSVIATGR